MLFFSFFFFFLVENNLIDDLLKNYSKNARPVKNSQDALKVLFGLSYIKINIDEEAQTETTIAYETQVSHCLGRTLDKATYKNESRVLQYFHTNRQLGILLPIPCK